MEPMIPVYLPFIAGVLLLFVLFWIGVVQLIARLSGWSKLARSFPMRRGALMAGKRFTWQSLRIGAFSNYSAVATVTVTHEGIGLELMKIFSMGHSPLFIPWHRTEGAESGTFPFPWFSFRVDGTRIMIMGRSAAETARIVPHMEMDG
jgi:hypothetical protein